MKDRHDVEGLRPEVGLDDGIVATQRWLAWLPDYLAPLTAARVTIVTEQLRTVLDQNPGRLLAIGINQSPGDAQPAAMALLMLQGGDAAVLLHAGWLRPPPSSDPASLLNRLGERIDRCCRKHDVRFVQWPCCPGAGQAVLSLPSRLGFESGGRLQFMAIDGVSAMSSTTIESGGAGGLELVPIVADDSASLDLIAQTYAGSLDCPALSRHRTPEQIVRGYRNSDGHHAPWWFRVRVEGRDCGVLIMGQHRVMDGSSTPSPPVAEIVYMALLPGDRGRGLGRALLRRSHLVASSGGADRVILAVDRDNLPAAALYRLVGYQVIFREDVWMKSVLPSSIGPDQMTEVVKIMTSEQWNRLQQEGAWTGSPDDQRDGFIHLSTADQTAGTLARHFNGQTGLVAVRVSIEALGETLRWERSRGGALFPHLYAPLEMGAVTGWDLVESVENNV